MFDPIKRLSYTIRLKSEQFLRQLSLQSMILPGLTLMAIFEYWPLYGLIIAFEDYSIIHETFFEAPFVGFAHFKEFFTDPNALRVIRNSLGINLIGLLVAFPITIIFALLLNEVTVRKYKRFVQTVSYLPHFVSWVIFIGIVELMLSVDNGVLNEVLMNLGLIKEPIFFMGRADYFWPLAAFTRLAKEMGWGAIIYLAAMAGIDPQLYEAAIVDGASRLQRMWHITLPGISQTIIILFILRAAQSIRWGFQQIYMMQNPVNISMSETIETYVFKTGLQNLRFSYATAVGLFQSVVSVVLLIIADQLSKRLAGKGIF